MQGGGRARPQLEAARTWGNGAEDKAAPERAGRTAPPRRSGQDAHNGNGNQINDIYPNP